jgi:general secretion pathway protein G
MSLVEVMVVIAIVLVLTAALASGVFTTLRKAQVQTSWLTVERTHGDVLVHEAIHHRLPTAGEGLAVVYGAEPIPRDAWGTELQYERPRDDFDIVSLGQDGTAGGTGYASDLRSSERPR